MSPRFSIITPTYNSEDTIRETIESVMRQSFLEWEHIIVDGRSTDGTQKILKEYDHLVIIAEPDKGVYDAMNKGISRATGEYLFFMGGDDVFYDDQILENVNNSIVDEEFVYGNVKFKHNGTIHSGESSLHKLLYDQISICHQACFYHKSIFEKLGLFDLKWFVHADFNMNIKIFEDSTIRKMYIDRIICLFNENGMSGSEPNADHFHDHLAEKSIEQNKGARDYIARLKHRNETLKSELQDIKSMRSYIWVKKIRSFLSKKKN